MNCNTVSQEHLEGWKKIRIGELGEVVSGGTPSTKIEEYYGGSISWITPKDLSGYEKRYIYKGERNITEKGLNNSSAKILPKGTVLFSSRAPIGYVAIAGQELATNQGFKNIICNPKIVNNHFMYYKLKTLKEHFESIAGGSTFKEVSGKIVKEQEILLPPLHEQEKIVRVLTALDDKIELNTEINQTLEEMAQAIFKRWFVDFEFPNENGEPYKSSGGKFVESELGMIPEGWIASNVLNHIEEFSQKNKEKKNYPVLSVTKDGVFVETNEYFQQETFEFYDKTVYSKKLAQYKLIYKNYIGYNPSRANIGSIAMLKSHEVGLISPIYKVFKLNKEISPYYFEQYMKDPEFIRLIRHYSSGTTRQNFDLNCFRFFKLVVPPMEVQKNYEKIAMIIEERIKQNTKEIELLRELRDTLLPKLMSGEIRVPNAEREVEACLQKSS